MRISQFAECPGCAARADEVDYLRATVKDLLEKVNEVKEVPFPEDVDFEPLEGSAGWASQKRRLAEKLKKEHREAIAEARNESQRH